VEVDDKDDDELVLSSVCVDEVDEAERRAADIEAAPAVVASSLSD